MNIKPCIIGLGYVGLPILAQLSKNFNSFGFDISKKRVETLKKFYDYNNEFKKIELSKIKPDNLKNEITKIVNCNFYIICVPTPIDKSKKPDLRLLKSAFMCLAKILKKGDIIVLESTVFPGTSENICAPILEKITGLKSNRDFFLCYSPERINPGDKNHTIQKIIKIISIPNKKCRKKVTKVYKHLSKKLIFSGSLQETELSKVIENIQRDLNIALMNEIFMFCEKTNLNFKNVVNLASTKWNFIKFEPGLVGGHCLPVDPYYFSYVANKKKIKTNVTLSGRYTNEYVYKFILERIKRIFEKDLKNKNFKVIFAGLTYKKNVSDLRNSLALKIYKYFEKKNKNIYGYDPHLKDSKIKNLINDSDLFKMKNIKYLIILTNHNVFKNLTNRLSKNIKVIKFFN